MHVKTDWEVGRVASWRFDASSSFSLHSRHHQWAWLARHVRGHALFATIDVRDALDEVAAALRKCANIAAAKVAAIVWSKFLGGRYTVVGWRLAFFSRLPLNSTHDLPMLDACESCVFDPCRIPTRCGTVDALRLLSVRVFKS